MCVELSKPSTTAQRAHTRHHPFFITPFLSRGQSQHSGQSQPWLLFSHEVGRAVC